MKSSLLFFITLIFIQTTSDSIIGNWKIVSYDAIDKIKTSPAYLYGAAEVRQLIDEQFETILKSGAYNFKKDTVYYSDLQEQALVTRSALWSLNEDILYFKEIDRPYERQAYVHHISQDSLVISPIINGTVGSSKIIFKKIK